MNWDAIGALGELLGSITVLITLIYLAIQTRSINKQSKAEARYAFVDAVGEINMVIGQSQANASVFRRGLEEIENLNSDEKMQFLMYVGQYSNLWSVMHQLNDDDMLPQTQWKIVCTDIVSVLGSDGGRWFWNNGGSDAFDNSFSEFVSSIIEAESKSYDMSAMANSGKG
jgi:hypothetical protein